MLLHKQKDQTSAKCSIRTKNLLKSLLEYAYYAPEGSWKYSNQYKG